MDRKHEDHKGYKRVEKPYKRHDEHWEIYYSPEKSNSRSNQMMGSDFNALPSKDRYKTYVPVNETDT